MAVAANKRSVMTLFSGANDMFSHQVRIVLAEKGVSVDICQVDPSNLPDELAELNPYNTVPTLVDRELALYTSRIIMEYLDERFPHPPLMPVSPVARGNSRLMMHRIELDWYSLADKIMAGTDTEAARAELRDNLLAILVDHHQLLTSDGKQFDLNPLATVATTATTQAHQGFSRGDTMATSGDKLNKAPGVSPPVASLSPITDPANTRRVATVAAVASPKQFYEQTPAERAP